MKVTVFEDPCPMQGHRMQEIINRMLRKTQKKCEQNSNEEK